MRIQLARKQTMCEGVGEGRWSKKTRLSPICDSPFLLLGSALVRVPSIVATKEFKSRGW